MNDGVISFETALAERELKKQFGSDHELVVAFYLAKRLRAEDMGERENELLCLEAQDLQRWVQKRLADGIETRGLRSASVYKMVPYVAQLLVSHQGVSTTTWRPTERYREYITTNNAFELLRLAEESFLVFCFFPEEKPRRVLKYRKHALEQGTQAYRVFGSVRNNPFGYCMDEAFVPLGTLARDMFAPRA